MRTERLRVGLLAVALVVARGPGMRAQNDDEFARRQYDSGRAFMQNQRYAEGLKDFQAVVDSFPKTSVADDALLQMALHHLDVGRDLDAARTTTDRLLKQYPDSDSAPMAYVIDGRLRIARGRATADVDAALASFERVSRLFPNSEAVAAARYFTGDTLQLARRSNEALDHLRRVTLEFPTSIWAARATLASAASFVESDRAATAFADLQRIRQRFPGSPEATAALNLNTILYRLYVRPAPLRYQFTGKYVGAETARFRDVVGVAVDSTGRILLGQREGISVFDPTGKLITTLGAREPSAFLLAGSDRVVVVQRDTLYADGVPPVAVTIPASAGRNARRVEEIPSAVALSNGDRLIADRSGRAVIRIRASGEYVGTFASINARRLAVNRLDDVAMIDDNSKGVTVADRDGKTLSTIPAKGTGYLFDDPADIAFDAFGHLYVLDAGRPTVYVFGPKNRLIATVAPSAKEQVALQRPRALALDAAGRMYVYDDRSQRIQVFQ
jgi:TolA-binding protein/sugar lactone lactonase YvrE